MAEKTSPLLSIIVPSYNNADLLENLLLSLKAQTFQNFELIIIDGESSDKTLTVIEEYGDMIHYSVSEKDRGIFDAMNKGINVANGEWLYFMGCDDSFYTNDTLETIFNQEISSCDIIYGRIFNDKKGCIEGTAIRNKIDLLNSQFWHQSMFYRATVFKQVGKYNLRYKIAADTAFNIETFCMYKFRWLYTEKAVSIFSGTGISSTVIDKNYHKDQWNLYLKWFKGTKSKLVYEALQYNVYNEILIGNLFKASYKLIMVMYHSKKFSPYLKHFLYWIKYRFTQTAD